MAKQVINVGSAPNDATGDPLRTAFTKSNDNFTELYAAGQELGQCRLVYVNSTTIRLDRCDGNKLFINGAFYEIPSAGVTYTYSGLTILTNYNVYAYMAGATMMLEVSTTARATDATYGNQIKSGDATRALVGKVRTTDTGTFRVSADTCYVISWFNRRPISLTNSLPSDYTTSTAPWVSIGTYVQFVAWGEDAVHCGINCSVFAPSTAALGYLAIYANDTTALMTGSNYSYGPSDYESMSLSWAVVPTEGYYFINPYVGAAFASVTFVAGSYTKIWAVIRG